MQAVESDYSSRYIFDVVAIPESKSKPVSMGVRLDSSFHPPRLTNLFFQLNRQMNFEYSEGTMDVSLAVGVQGSMIQTKKILRFIMKLFETLSC